MSGLVTTTILNTKLEQAENKISDVNGLVKKTDYNAIFQAMKKTLLLINKYDMINLNNIINLPVKHLIQR